MNIQVLKYIDRTFGVLLARLLTTPAVKPIPVPEKILIIRPGGIGDAVQLSPAIKALRKTFPAADITILAERRNRAAFTLTPNVARVFCYDRLPELAQCLNGTYDLVIDTEQWHYLSAVVSRLAGGAMSIGYATNDRKKFFTHTASYSHDDYEVESFFRLLAPLGIDKPLQPQDSCLAVPEWAREKANVLLRGFSAAPFVVVFPGASISERRWGAKRFRGVAEKLHAKGILVVVVGGKEDQRVGDEIIRGMGGLNLAGKTSLVETVAVIDRGAFLLSGDSGILHIGVGLGKPTVSLFGPGIAKKWAPRGENHIVLNKNLPCSPCTKFGYTPKCPINAKCMSDITVDEVFDAVMQLLERTSGLPNRKTELLGNKILDIIKPTRYKY